MAKGGDAHAGRCPRFPFPGSRNCKVYLLSIGPGRSDRGGRKVQHGETALAQCRFHRLCRSSSFQRLRGCLRDGLRLARSTSNRLPQCPQLVDLRLFSLGEGCTKCGVSLKTSSEPVLVLIFTSSQPQHAFSSEPLPDLTCEPLS
jgi:hypothetical protein